KQRLRPTATPDRKQVERLLADLDSDTFQTRKDAFEGLQKLADLAESSLRERLDRPSTLEVRRQVERLLEAVRLGQTPEQLFSARAIQALEWMGTAESAEYLKELAGGATSRQTANAKAALSRRR